MKAYRLKITCFILLLLPVLTCCTDEEAASGQRCPGRRAHDGRHQRGYGSQQGQDTFGPAGRRGEKDI